MKNKRGQVMHSVKNMTVETTTVKRQEHRKLYYVHRSGQKNIYSNAIRGRVAGF